MNAHRTLFSPIREAQRNLNRRFALVAGPSVAVWFGFTIVALWSGWLRGWPAWAVVAEVFAGSVLIPSVAFGLASTSRRNDIRVIEESLLPCAVCGGSVAGRDRQQHLKVAHPEVGRELQSLMVGRSAPSRGVAARRR